MIELSKVLPALPEIALALGAMAMLMAGVFSEKNSYNLVRTLGVGLMLIVGALVLRQAGGGSQMGFNGQFIFDNFSAFLKILILLGSGAALLMSSSYLRENGIDKFEYPVLMVLATLGMFVMVSAGSLLVLYIGLELQSLALYVLAAINRDRARSTEAGLKYFVLGALSSGMLLYGISLIYGFTGSVEFNTFYNLFQNGESGIGMTVGMVFLIAGLAFKISAVPFHMWTPDVYEGAPTPVTAFFAAAPKVAALGLLTRVLMGAFPNLLADWQQIIIFMAIASMMVGAFIAIVQTNIKRLMAYSSIGHIGYALVGLAAGTQAGVEALIMYIAIYLTMTLGSFGAILAMKRENGQVETISDLAGLSKTNLPLATMIAIFMFSLAGIPLLLGFWGKWYVFVAAVKADLVELVTIALVTSVVSAFYYLRVVKVMFFDEAEEPFEPIDNAGVRWVLGVNALINSPISYVLVVGPLLGAAAWAASGLVV